MKVCPYCADELDAGAVVCRQCGKDTTVPPPWASASEGRDETGGRGPLGSGPAWVPQGSEPGRQPFTTLSASGTERGGELGTASLFVGLLALITGVLGFPFPIVLVLAVIAIALGFAGGGFHGLGAGGILLGSVIIGFWFLGWVMYQRSTHFEAPVPAPSGYELRLDEERSRFGCDVYVGADYTGREEEGRQAAARLIGTYADELRKAGWQIVSLTTDQPASEVIARKPGTEEGIWATASLTGDGRTLLLAGEPDRLQPRHPLLARVAQHEALRQKEPTRSFDRRQRCVRTGARLGQRAADVAGGFRQQQGAQGTVDIGHTGLTA